MICGILTSCINSADNNITNGSVLKPVTTLYPKLLLLAQEYRVPLKNADVVLIPPSKCIACQMGALKVLDSLESCYILHSKQDTCFKRKEKQICEQYNYEYLRQNQLIKLYAIYFKIVDGKIVEYKPL